MIALNGACALSMMLLVKYTVSAIVMHLKRHGVEVVLCVVVKLFIMT